MQDHRPVVGEASPAASGRVDPDSTTLADKDATDPPSASPYPAGPAVERDDGKPIDIPNVIAQDREQAEESLRLLGLRPKTSRRRRLQDGPELAEIVVSQRPKHPTSASGGDTVRLTVQRYAPSRQRVQEAYEWALAAIELDDLRREPPSISAVIPILALAHHPRLELRFQLSESDYRGLASTCHEVEALSVEVDDLKAEESRVLEVLEAGDRVKSLGLDPSLVWSGMWTPVQVESSIARTSASEVVDKTRDQLPAEWLQAIEALDSEPLPLLPADRSTARWLHAAEHDEILEVLKTEASLEASLGAAPANRSAARHRRLIDELGAVQQWREALAQELGDPEQLDAPAEHLVAIAEALEDVTHALALAGFTADDVERALAGEDQYETIAAHADARAQLAKLGAAVDLPSGPASLVDRGKVPSDSILIAAQQLRDALNDARLDSLPDGLWEAWQRIDPSSRDPLLRLASGPEPRAPLGAIRDVVMSIAAANLSWSQVLAIKPASDGSTRDVLRDAAKGYPGTDREEWLEKLPEACAREQAPPNPRDVKLPDVRHLSNEAAEEALREAGLQPIISASIPSEHPAGTVIEQKPEPPPSGTCVVPEGSIVVLTPASGYNTVPPILGAPIREAAEKLVKAGFEVDQRGQPFPGPPGIVTEVDPPSGRGISLGTRVTIVYSQKPPEQPAKQLARVPYLLGKTEQEAIDLIDSRGLTAFVDHSEVGTNPGHVVEQYPDHNQEVTLPSRVVVVVDSGAPGPPAVQPPSPRSVSLTREPKSTRPEAGIQPRKPFSPESDAARQPSPIVEIDIRHELENAFLDYAMSVIHSRALPDVRDGLKPIHRRLLYSMYMAGQGPDADFARSAQVVGGVLATHHPHGDSAIYEAVVRLTAPWQTRAPLLDGRGDFGSPRGGPAATRYTSCRLSPLGLALVRDSNETTSAFRSTYDGQANEPTVLPAPFPNLLVNGSSGIAVGFATQIPPHNLREVAEGVTYALDNPNATREELLEALVERIPGPDFPTGGIIVGRAGIEDAYRTGRGTVRVRAAVDRVRATDGHDIIVVTELPWQVHPEDLLTKIVQLHRAQKLFGIADVVDQSSGGAVRLEIHLLQDAVCDDVLDSLYRYTRLETSYGLNLVALVAGVPRTLRLDQLVQHWIQHRLSSVRDRAISRLHELEEKTATLTATLQAWEHIDTVISVVNESDSPDAAQARLQDMLGIDEREAASILGRPLKDVAALSPQNLADELNSLADDAAHLRVVLSSDDQLRGIVRTELTEIAAALGDDRRTRLIEEDPPAGGQAVDSNRAPVSETARRDHPRQLPTRATLAGRLLDCSHMEPEARELYVVGGPGGYFDHGSGAVEIARDPERQAVLRIRGKVSNAQEASLKHILHNADIRSLIDALGTGSGAEFDPGGLRYHKVVLMNDRDVDGSHLRALLLTAIFRVATPLAAQGHIYVVDPPRYRIRWATGDTAFAYSDAQRDAVVGPTPNVVLKRSSRVAVDRIRGFGQLTSEELRHVAMDPKHRVLRRVTVEDLELAEQTFAALMGSDVARRRELVGRSAVDPLDLDL